MKPRETRQMPSLRERRLDTEMILDDLASIVPVELLQQMQDAMSSALDVPMLFVSSDGKPVTKSDSIDTFCWQITQHGKAEGPCLDCSRLAQAANKDARQSNDCPMDLRDTVLSIEAGELVVGYLLASWTSADHLAAVSPAISSLARTISALASASRESKTAAVTDRLTGLASREYFWECLERELELADQYNYPVTIMLIDLDNFKKINDTFGHAAGDSVLHAIGGILANETRKSDIAARYGSDAFLLMLRCSDPSNADAVAWRLRNRISGCEITVRGQCIPLSATIGHVTYPTCVGREPDAIFKECLATLRKAPREKRKAA